MKTETITYKDGNEIFEGFCAYPDFTNEKKPAILVAHDWSGRNDFACNKAKLLAEMGYIGFALDMYGQAKIGNTKEEKTALMQPLMQDRKLLQSRILKALETVSSLEMVNTAKIGAIGFCFGGLCVLDLARSGAKINGVVSFHGLLQAAEQQNTNIHAKILALHGYDDPMVKHDQILAFGDEMTKAKCDWQLIMYGNTMHAFMNPEANDPDFGTVYNTIVAKRAWVAMQNFFAEIFG